jgi:hypothetical protein
MLLNVLYAIVIRLVLAVWRTVIGSIDRWTDPPIMRQRINKGSDKYFEWRAEHEGDSELDELLDMANERGEDDKD